MYLRFQLSAELTFKAPGRSFEPPRVPRITLRAGSAWPRVGCSASCCVR
jgi:hypothetical protein